MTRVFFVRKDKHISVEKTDSTYDLWELRDGFHSWDKIFTHRENMYSPVIVYFEDIVSPVGSSRSVENVNQIAATIDLVKDGGGARTSISRMFGRFLGKIWKYFAVIIVAVLIAYGLIAGYYHIGV